LIGVTPRTARAIQRLADAGRPSATYYRNPIAVLYHNLPGYGFKGTFTINQPITITVRYNHRGYDIHLRQLAKTGKGGAWFISSIAAHPGALPPAPTPLPGSPPTPVPAGVPHLGTVTHSPSNVKAIQTQATAGNAAYIYYLNPVAVVERNLSAYGFTLPVPIVQPLIITVTYQGKMYDILLKQPVKQGLTGIWVTQEIRLHK